MPDTSAHHGAAAFDGTRTVEVVGKVARRERSIVKWPKDIFRPGDDITLIGNPAGNGAPSLRLREVLDADGMKMIGGR